MGLTEGQAHGGGRVEMVDGDAAGEEGGREGRRRWRWRVNVGGLTLGFI